MTRRPDPRRANRRGNDNADLGYLAPDGTAFVVRWPTPRDTAGIVAKVRERERTGACVVCHTATDAPGVTCKSLRCLKAWLFGG